MRVAIAPEGTFFEIDRYNDDRLRLILRADGINASGAVYIDAPIDADDKEITRGFLRLVKRYEITQKAEERLGIYRVFPKKEEA